jgi:flagellar biogenesis protein FliO
MRVRGATRYSELVSRQGTGSTLLENLMSAARFLWQRVSRVTHRQPRGLRLCESLSLGERRFVAVVEFESARFLLGGTSGSLVLLTKLETTADTAHSEGSSRIPANEETDK